VSRPTPSQGLMELIRVGSETRGDKLWVPANTQAQVRTPHPLSPGARLKRETWSSRFSH
jgi:hypothetical protein